MLTRDERKEVEEELEVAFIGATSVQEVCNQIFSAQATELLRNFPVGATVPAIAAQFVVVGCLVSRWTVTPSLLAQLLDYLIQRKGVGRFAGLLDRVNLGNDPNPSPYDSLWVHQEHPFFDRDDLRDRSQRLLEGSARPLLRITGSTDAFGRSYSRRFFEHLEAELATTVRFVVVELADGTGPSFDVDELAEKMGSQIGVAEAIPPRSASSYPRALCRWVLRHAMSRPGMWVFVLDGFGQKGVKPEVREMIEALAAEVPVGQHRQRIRVVLVEYPHDLPQVSPADILDETLREAERVTSADILPCVVAYDAQAKAQGKPGIRTQDFAEIATGIDQRAPQRGKERLQSLNDSLRGLLQL